MSDTVYVQVSLTYEQYMAMTVALLYVSSSDSRDAIHAHEAFHIIARQARVIPRKGA